MEWHTHDFCQVQPFEIISRQQPGFETEGKGLAVLGCRRRRTGRQKTGGGYPGSERFKGTQGCVIETGGSCQSVQPRRLLEDQSNLRKPAVTGDGLAKLVGLAIEVLNPPAGEHDLGIGLQFGSGTSFALLGGLFVAELIFEREDDHAHGCHHFAEDREILQPEQNCWMNDEVGREDGHVECPGKEAERAQNRSGGQAAEDIEDEKSSGEMERAFNKNQGPAAANRDTYPETDGAHRYAEGEPQRGGHATTGKSPEASHKKRDRAESRKDEEREVNRHLALVNTIDQDSVDGKRNDERNRKEDAPPLEPKGKRGQGGKEECGADECRGLSGGRNPWMLVGAGKIPQAHLVDLHHAQAREEKTKEPEQGAGIART